MRKSNFKGRSHRSEAEVGWAVGGHSAGGAGEGMTWGRERGRWGH